MVTKTDVISDVTVRDSDDVDCRVATREDGGNGNKSVILAKSVSYILATD